MNAPACPPALLLPPRPFAEPSPKPRQGGLLEGERPAPGHSQDGGRAEWVWGWGKMESNQHSIHQETDFGKFKQCPILWASAT